MTIKKLSPSLSILNPEVTAIFSIFNRIFGILILFFFNFIFILINIIKFFQISNFIIHIIILFLFFIIGYHIMYSNLKLSLYYNKVFIFINSNIKKINNIYIINIIFLFILLIFNLIIYYNFFNLNNIVYVFLFFNILIKIKLLYKIKFLFFFNNFNIYKKNINYLLNNIKLNLISEFNIQKRAFVYFKNDLGHFFYLIIKYIKKWYLT